MGNRKFDERDQGTFKLVLQRLPRVLLRRGARSIVIGMRHHLRALFLLCALSVIILVLITGRSSADNWDMVEYVTCILGVRKFFRKELVTNGINIFPLYRSWSDTSECRPLPTVPSPYICIHNVEIDR